MFYLIFIFLIKSSKEIEKTFIDMAYFNEKLDKNTLNNFKNRINRKKLDKYLKLYPKKFRAKVMHLITLKK